MNNNIDKIRNKLSGKGLKITPQRISILEAIYNIGNHPTAEHILEHVRKTNPNIATGTVYKVLDTLVSNNIIKKVKTEKDIMRYDGVIENHHHLYCMECDYIEDYKDPELDRLLKSFFEKNEIENFIIEDVKLQINGRFIKHKI